MAAIGGIEGMRTWTCWALTASCLLLAGCGEFSYKRGASIADLDAARRQCAATDSDAGLAACLERQGWIVGNFDRSSSDEDEPVLRASYREDPRGPAAAEPSATAPAAAVAGVLDAPPPKSPLDIYYVSSWWKAGGSPAALKSDTAQCVTTLGEIHRPDPGSGRTTRALLRCMRERGWYALQAG